MDLYRILPFPHLVEIFEKKELSLSCPKSWDDPYESLIAEKYLSLIFAQCWCTVSLSDALWRIYSPDRLSVRIRTTESRLRAQVRAGLSDPNRFQLEIGKVNYDSTKEVQKATQRQLSQYKKSRKENDLLASLLFKRNAYKHESEYRVVVFDKQADRNQVRLPVPINPHELISSVLADPRAADETVDVLSFYLKKKLKFKGPVNKSRLNEKP